MYYIKDIYENKIVIQKSEFIGILYPITMDTDISTLINDAKKRYPKATHYCSAYIRGKNAEYASANDDGEPSRTAGVPILEILKAHNLTDCLCVVVRYFGGIKLGSGGLIRAYSGAAKEVVKIADIYKRILASHYLVKMPYSLIDRFEYAIKDHVTIIQKDYTDIVSYEFTSLEPIDSLLTDMKHEFKEFLELNKIETFVLVK